MAVATIPREKIAQRAYEIFKSRGGKPGKDLDDWLRAEKELAGNRIEAVSFQGQPKKIKQNQTASYT